MPWRDTVFHGDARKVLREIPRDSVHCTVTSPPYYQQRDYQIRHWLGGDPDCPHETDDKYCPSCGARLGQLGLEDTPDEYVEHLADVFDEVWRVTHPSGTLWVNLDDSYAGGGGYCPTAPTNINGSKHSTVRGAHTRGARANGDIKSKDMMGIPWLFAIEMRRRGWYWRSVIVWVKPSALPENLTDRPTNTTEWVFLFSKSAQYAYDIDAVREPATTPINGRGSTKERQAAGHPRRYGDTPSMTHRGQGFTMPSISAPEGGRNSRNVWIIPTKAVPNTHIATFPEELPRRCIKAGTSKAGCCPECYAPWKTCSCKTTMPIPCVVLDPFAGSGTTLAVAKSLGRDFVGIEVQQDYRAFIDSRLEKVSEIQEMQSVFDEMHSAEWDEEVIEFVQHREQASVHQSRPAHEPQTPLDSILSLLGE